MTKSEFDEIYKVKNLEASRQSWDYVFGGLNHNPQDSEIVFSNGPAPPFPGQLFAAMKPIPLPMPYGTGVIPPFVDSTPFLKSRLYRPTEKFLEGSGGNYLAVAKNFFDVLWRFEHPQASGPEDELAMYKMLVNLSASFLTPTGGGTPQAYFITLTEAKDPSNPGFGDKGTYNVEVAFNTFVDITIRFDRAQIGVIGWSAMHSIRSFEPIMRRRPRIFGRSDKPAWREVHHEAFVGKKFTKQTKKLVDNPNDKGFGNDGTKDWKDGIRDAAKRVAVKVAKDAVKSAAKGLHDAASKKAGVAIKKRATNALKDILRKR